jgi:non-ribosomal peptide synthetase component F
MYSFVHINSFKKSDTVLQMARCSFDIHLQDIMGTLLIGATLIMLHPKGNLDFDYLTTILRNKQTSYVHTVPSLLYNLFTFLKETNNWHVASCFRSICSGGKC